MAPVRQKISFVQKGKIIENSKNGMSVSKLSKKYGIPISTIGRIVRLQESILNKNLGTAKVCRQE